jgi:hypothetical protein
MNLTRYRASVFTPALTIGNYAKYIRLFQDVAGDKLDGQVMSLPVPQDAPAEIPRLSMSASDNTWRVQMSPLRTDVSYHRINNFKVDIPTPGIFSEFVLNIFGSFLNDPEISAQRLSYVTERVLEIPDDTPANFIAKRFCRDEYLEQPFNNPNVFEIHSLKKYTWNTFRVNSWVRIKSAMIEALDLPVVGIINDFNTLSMEEAPDTVFNIDQIADFIQHAPEEIDSICSLYLKDIEY